MSYQVLARKWRPRTFREMVGQEHVLQALVNALDHNRLHHAYLFTGTRGVGKTTIARILSKCLNCETGISSEPCGQCSTCMEIDQGRFVDLIEVDAASRTKVEDTRELLDNVQYAPSRGRYKVYLIDEVHMLSSHSFNALLKTLEEPPPHVKFLLATTDPQKLPVTILSRCLQFSLKHMSPERIVGHLQHVLEKEMVPFEEPALWQLGRAADGSMRDAMSLTDQAIAFGNGKVNEDEVRSMLGSIDQGQVYKLLNALVSTDASKLLTVVAEVAEHAPDYKNLLAEMISVLHRVAIAQVVPEAVDNSQGDKEQVLTLAQSLPVEDIQLYYQAALIGRRDLPLSPEARAGFEMTLLRMLAFKPNGVPQPPKTPLGAGSGGSQVQGQSGVSGASHSSPAATGVQNNVHAMNIPSNTASQSRGIAGVKDALTSGAVVSNAAVSPLAIPAKEPMAQAANQAMAVEQLAPVEHIEPVEIIAEPTVEAVKPINKIPLNELNSDTWIQLLSQLDLAGVTYSVASSCALIDCDSSQIRFVLNDSNSALLNDKHQQRINEALNSYFNLSFKLHIEIGVTETETPALYASRKKSERQAEAVVAIHQDKNVEQLIKTFNAVVDESSIAPTG